MNERIPLETLLGSPERALEIPRLDAARLLAQIEGVAAMLRLAAAGQGSPAGRNGDHVHENADRLLTPQEAAERLGLTVKQVYRRAKRWPFTRRPSPGTLGFSERGLEAWLAKPQK